MLLSLFLTEVQAQCEADTTIYLTDFVFTPSSVTISVGQTVAFVNAEGIHNVDGSAESNPVPFFLDETEGNINGVCMGTVTFDVPGTYTFTSSIGVQPELGMTGTIVVDAETLADVMARVHWRWRIGKPCRLAVLLGVHHVLQRQLHQWTAW